MYHENMESRMNESDFEILCDAAELGFCKLNLDMTIAYANRIFKEHFRQVTIAKTSFYDLIHPDEQENIKQKLKNKNDIVYYGTVALDSDGQSFRVVVSSVCKDKFIYCLVSFKARTHGALNVDDTIRLFSIAVEHSPSSVVITDQNGSIEYVNPKFSELTGYSFDEVLGQNPRILKSGIQTKEFYKDMWDIIKNGKEWRGEFHNKKKNGELYWEIASISPVISESGAIRHYVAVKEDISKRKSAEEALRRSEEKLKKRNEEIERELSYAQVVVKQLLPERAPQVEHLKIYNRYKPMDTVGGDIFSFNKYNKDDVGVFLADVVGHGVSAALFLALVKSTSDAISTKQWRNPAAYLKELNDEILRNISEYFITALYAIFVYKQHGYTMHFARGGHPPPIHYRYKEEKALLVKTKGKPLGFFEDIRFQEQSLSMYKGDRIFLYTDGLNETIDKNKKMLDYEGLVDIVNATSGLDLDRQLDMIIDRVDNYRESTKADDDIVLIGIEVT